MKIDANHYMFRGLQAVGTDSPLLVSSSKYLNSPELREWVSTHFLRRSSRLNPTPSDAIKLGMILLQVQDLAAVESMFAAERKRWPELDAWFEEGFVSTFTKEDFGGYAPDTVGGIYYRNVIAPGLEIDLIPRFKPQSQYQYYLLRNGQIHDFEHIVCGGGFDVLGELVPYYMRLANVPRFLSAELAGEVNAAMALGSTRIFLRTALHYQAAMPAALETIQRGITVGQQSGPMFMARYEPVFGMSVPEAREALGVRGVVEADTEAASRQWEEHALA
jgi:ubiquinone biosynthesis protein Coq4